MAYRDSSDDPERTKREAAKERLLSLAEEDHPANKNVVKEQKRIQKEKLAIEHTKQQQALRRVRDSIAGDVVLQRFYVFFPVFILFGIGFVSLAPLYMGIPFAIAYLSLMAWSIFRPGILVSREQQWLQSFPFAVSGYFEALRFYDPIALGSVRGVTLKLSLKDDSGQPDLALLQKLFGKHSAKVQAEKGMISITRGGLKYTYTTTLEKYDDTIYSNKETRIFLHFLLNDILMPFHEAYPIKDISIGSYS
jgi:hypothetical protein